MHHGIPGNRHHRGLLVGHVVAGQQHRVRVAAAPRVPAQDQDRVIVLTLPFPVAAGAGPFAPVDLLFLGPAVRIRVLLRQIRANEQALAGHHRDQHDGQYHGYRDQQLLLPRQAARFLRLLGSALFGVPPAGCFPFSLSTVSLSFQCVPRLNGGVGTGFPISVISSMVISRPISRPSSRSL